MFYICKKNIVKKFFLNKYFYVGFGFLLWMLFADQESLVVQYKLSDDIKTLEKQKEFYLEEIAKNQSSLEILTNDTASLEKFARENYFMKKDNEEVFVVVEEE
ncbi:MAG: septum formation initiator [Marinilabiliales bacterium]|nr:MAG: septum formation initiator [Marinilabiliales bacterium]